MIALGTAFEAFSSPAEHDLFRSLELGPKSHSGNPEAELGAFR